MAERKRTPLRDAKQLLEILANDRDRKLNRIHDYVHGHHDDPYMPDSATAEYKMLAQRSITNWMPLIVESSVQMLCIDGVRPGRELPEGYRMTDLPEWNHWQLSRLDARQLSVYRDALRYGHAFTLTELRRGKVQTKGLSPRKTAALYVDPANDETPRAALTVTAWPDGDDWGTATLWDDTKRYEVTFRNLHEFTDEAVKVNVSKAEEHGASACPVTRFAAQIDLDGRTMGVVEPMIVLQNRINQTVFDLLAVQTGGAFKVRFAAGMAPPYKMTREFAEDGTWDLVPELDEAGNPVVDEYQLSVSRILFGVGEVGEDGKPQPVQFGTLDETPLDGYIAAIGNAIQTLAAQSQTPPHYLLGQMINIAADAMQVAEVALERKAGTFRSVFGESWERVFRLAAELAGEREAIDDYKIEVTWKDTEARALAKYADASLKLSQMGVPPHLLIRDLPGMTTEKADDWEEEMKKADAAGEVLGSLVRNRNARPTSAAQSASRSAIDEVP